MLRTNSKPNIKNKLLISIDELQKLIELREVADDLWKIAESLPYDDEIKRENTDAKFEEALQAYIKCHDAYNQYKKMYGDVPTLINNVNLMLSILPTNSLCGAEHFYFITKTLADAYYEMGGNASAIPLYSEAREFLIYCKHKNIDSTLKDLDLILQNLDFNAALNKLTLAEQAKTEKKDITHLIKTITNDFINHLESILTNDEAKPYEIHIALEYILRVRKLITNQVFNFKEARDLERLKWCIIDILNRKQIECLIHLRTDDKSITLQDIMSMLTPKLNQDQWKKFQKYTKPAQKRKKDLTIQEYATEVAYQMTLFEKSAEFEKLNLYPHQQEALKKIAAHFSGSNTKAGITMATGTGKTHVFISFLLAAQTMSNNASDYNNQAFIVVPQLSLSDQTFTRIKELMKTCNLYCDIGVFNGHQKSQHKITIITLDSLQNEMKKSPSQRQLNINLCRLIVVDEVHLALSQKCKELLFELSADKLILTFTATDTYNTIRLHGALKSVKELIGEENCIYHYSLLKAIEDRVLSPIRVCTVNGLSHVPHRKASSTDKTTEVNLKKVNDHLSKDGFDEINSTIAEQYLHVLHPDTKESLIGKSAFAFCVSIHHAETLAAKLNQILANHHFFTESKSIPAASISGQDSADKQAKLLNEFRKGKIKILCGADILITGVDVPDMEVIFNIRPTRSNVLAAQRFGRLTRRSKSNPNKIGLVFEYPIVPHQVFASQFLNGKQQAGLIPPLANENIKFSRQQIPAHEQIEGACQWEMQWDIIKKRSTIEAGFIHPIDQPFLLQSISSSTENTILLNQPANSTTSMNIFFKNAQKKARVDNTLNQNKENEVRPIEHIIAYNQPLEIINNTPSFSLPNNIQYENNMTAGENDDPYLSEVMENTRNNLFFDNLFAEDNLELDDLFVKNNHESTSKSFYPGPKKFM